MADPFKTPKPFKAQRLNKSKGILDDHAVRKSVVSREGSITKTPVADIDIANKKYVDDEDAAADAHIISDGTDHANVVLNDAHRADNTQAHTDYMLNTGDTATGNYTFDTDTLFIDAASNEVGIGTIDPNTNLEIVGDTNAQLQIRKNAVADGTEAGIKFTLSTDPTSNIGAKIYAIRTNVGQAGDTDLIFQTTDGTVLSTNMIIKDTGNVGINTTTPGKELEVAGDIKLDNGGKVYLWQANDLNYIQYNLWLATTSGAMTIQNDGTGDIVINPAGGSKVSVSTSAIPSGNPNFYVYGYKTAVGGKYIKLHVSTGGHGYLTAEDRLYLVGSTIRNQADTYVAGEIYATGAISSGSATITASADDTNVAGINTLFINPAAATVIGGFVGGIAGQVLYVSAIANGQDITLEHAEGIGAPTQDIYLHSGIDETLSTEYGGWTLTCDGTNWYDTSHAKHV